MDKKIVVLNHKNYLDFSSVKSYLLEINNYIRSDLDVIICPNSLYVPFFRGKYSFLLGVQDVGLGVVGEISASCAKSMDVKYSLVGHGERKEILSESNKIINLKIKDCIDNGIRPIVFLGETFLEYSRKKTQDVISKQIRDYFKDVDVREDIIVCYEPIFSIGKDDCLDSSFIASIVSLIKMIFIKNFGCSIKVLYGGGVNEKNISSLTKIEELDGFVLGNVSVYPDRVLDIFNKI